jgi:hypothetical protein
MIYNGWFNLIFRKQIQEAKSYEPKRDTGDEDVQIQEIEGALIQLTVGSLLLPGDN